MKLRFKLLGITTAILVCLEAVSVKASTPQIGSDLPNINLLAQIRRFPRQPLNNLGAFRVPILGRKGGIPIVAVTLDGQETFPMMVDTGASVTMITPEMARSIRFRPQGKERIKVASGEVLDVPTGRISSIQVGGATINNFEVLVGNMPLLGQNFISQYNLVVAQDFIVFRPKRR